MRYCSNCGNPFGGSPRYCAGCGTQTDPGSGTASGSSEQDDPAAPVPAGTGASAWSFQEPPAPWAPGDASRIPPGVPDWPIWGASEAPSAPRTPFADLGNPPWDTSDPFLDPEESPWPAPDPARTASDRPWGAESLPLAHDQAEVGAGRDTRTSPLARLVTARARRPHQLSTGHGMTLTAMVTTVALLATGGIAAWQVGRTGGQVPASATRMAAPGTTRTRPAGAPHAGHSPAPAARTPSTTSPSVTSPSVTSPAAVGPVRVTPAAAAQPHVQQVVMLLDSYFSAINRHDFPAYSALFIPAIRATMHNFGPSYLSTRDSRAKLTGLSATGPEGLAAMLTFVSHQLPAFSPDHAACNRWHITLFLKQHKGNGYHIRHRQPGFPPDTVRACR